jgi:hypothetical protein
LKEERKRRRRKKKKRKKSLRKREVMTIIATDIIKDARKRDDNVRRH